MKSKVILMTMLLAFMIARPVTAEIINFSTASDSGNTAPLWVAADLGFFEKYGNTVRLVFIQGATVSISALLNNDVHMAQFSPMLAIANNLKGMDFTITMSFNQFMDNNVFGRKESPTSNRSRAWQSVAMAARRISWDVFCCKGRA